jgi:hypothetical protein
LRANSNVVGCSTGRSAGFMPLKTLSHVGFVLPLTDSCTAAIGAFIRSYFVGAASLAYVAPVATAFAYWAVVEAGANLPPAPCPWRCSRLPASGF